MPYPKSRLEKALRIFRDVKPSQKRRDSKNDIQGRHLRKKEALFQASSTYITAWQKDSQSDDEYNPKNSKKKGRLDVSAKQRRAKRKSENDGSDRDKKRIRSNQHTDLQTNATGSCLQLKLSSEKGKELLKSLSEIHGFGSTSYQNCTEEDSPSLFRLSGGSFEDGQSKSRGPNEDPLLRDQSFLQCVGEDCRGIEEVRGRSLRSRVIPESHLREPKRRSCDRCLKMRRRCSMKRKHEDGPCKSCVRENEECVTSVPREHGEKTDTGDCPESPNPVEPILQTETAGRKTESSSTASPTTNEKRNSMGSSMEDPILLSDTSPSPILRPVSTLRIGTSWAHPIDFQYIPKSEQAPCDFCSDFTYGITGLGWVTVEVLGSSKTGYEEVANGHRSKGRSPTKMCVICALNRLLITRCTLHRVEAIPGLDPKDFDPSVYAAELCGKTGNRLSRSTYPVCSLCPAPALWKCCSRQKTDRSGRVQPREGGLMGCGIQMCNGCKSAVVMNRGTLTREGLDKGRQRQSVKLPLRADIEFLFPGSLLHQAYGQN